MSSGSRWSISAASRTLGYVLLLRLDNSTREWKIERQHSKDNPLEPTQLNLFSNLPRHPKSPSRQERLVMSADALLAWKAKIATYQQQVKASLPAKQDTLFDLAGLGISPAHVDPDTIDPFSLLLQPMSFWRWPVDSLGDSCIYIAIDIAVPLTTESCSTDTNTPTGKLVLYIGETCRSNHRWKDNHGCKEYLSKYQDLHYRYGMKTGVGIGFWWNTPVQRKPRQQLELALIKKWQSPFNKENWERWGQPFG